jgi:hypothetical protein
MSAQRKANRSNRLDEQSSVIDWRREFPEPLATIGLEISEELHRIATERSLEPNTGQGRSNSL